MPAHHRGGPAGRALLVGVLAALAWAAPASRAAGDERAGAPPVAAPSSDQALRGGRTERVLVRLQPQISAPALHELCLGDLAELDGPAAARAAPVVVGMAPLPGSRRGVTRGTIVRALERAGILRDDIRFEGATTALVEAHGQTLDEQRVRGVIERLVAGIAAERELSISVRSLVIPKSIELPPGEYQVQASVRDGALAAGANRVTVEVTTEVAPPRRIPVQVDLAIEGQVVVAAREVRRGMRIVAEDLRWQRGAWERGRTPLTDIGAAIGRTARSTIEVGDVLSSRAVGPSLAVVAGQPVIAISRNGQIALELQTVARGSGEIGAIVPVAGVDGGRLVEARVIAPGRVVMLGSDPIASASPTRVLTEHDADPNASEESR